MTRSHRITHHPVADGSLAVGRWEGSAPPVVAFAGLASTHLAWSHLAADPARTFGIIAPDLRGRGGSAALPGPFGMDRHVDDVIALLDALEVRRAILLGHSMGAFLAVSVAVAHPDRVAGVVLVDGGVPPVAANNGRGDLTRMVLEKTREQLDRIHSSVDEYVAQQAGAQAEGVGWDDLLARSAAYELTEVPGGFRKAASFEAIAADALHIDGEASERALLALRSPAVLLRAEEGMFGRGPLYPRSEAERWRSRVPALRFVDVPGVNHASIVVRAAGTGAVIRAVEEMRTAGRGGEEPAA